MLFSIFWWFWSCLVHTIDHFMNTCEFECNLVIISMCFASHVFSQSNRVFNWKDAFSVIHVSPGSAETLLMWDWKIKQLLIAQSISNAFAKNYENQIMLARVTAKNVRNPFLRHSVYAPSNFQQCSMYCALPDNLGKPAPEQQNIQDFNEARMIVLQWHELNHLQSNCTLLQK